MYGKTDKYNCILTTLRQTRPQSFCGLIILLSTVFGHSKKLKQSKPILRQLSRTKLYDLSRRAAEAYDDLVKQTPSQVLIPKLLLNNLEHMKDGKRSRG